MPRAELSANRSTLLPTLPTRWVALVAFVLGLAASAVLLFGDVEASDPMWWFRNEAPPALSLEGPAGTVRGSVQGLLRLERPDRARVVSATLDGRPIAVEGSRIAIETAGLADGPHLLAVVVRDISRRQNQARGEWTFVSDNNGPRIDVTVDPAEGPAEGRTLVLRLRLSEPAASVVGEIDGRPMRLQPDGPDGFWALSGAPPEPTSESLEVALRATDGVGNETAWQRTFPIAQTPFPEEALDFDPALDYLAERDVRAQENAQLMPIYQKASTPPLWDGRFRLPVEAPITTEFATRRSYNGRSPEGNHAGLDYGSMMGDPVQAPADGIVRFAARVPVRGNVLILEHGAGVYSTYGHLQGFEVGIGDRVRTGQVIARVGSTGLSTGPHLHWEMWVDGANVDPTEWTRRSFP